MDLLSNLALGFETALQWQNVLFCLVGVALGTAVGVLPGIGPTATVAMLLPITYTFDEPVTAIIMLAGIYYGAQYGGSTPAILINLPGESSSAVTALDGYQMARQGRAGTALAVAAISSFVAGTLATVVLAVAAIPLARAALNFGQAELFAVVVLGLVVSIALASGSTLKALAMIVLGILLSTVGRDGFTNTARFTFGVPDLDAGFNFVSVAVGLFGIAEILRNLHDPQRGGRIVGKVTGLTPSRADLRKIVGPVARATGLGSALGVLPGGGHVLASFGSYAAEKRLSKRRRTSARGRSRGWPDPRPPTTPRRRPPSSPCSPWACRPTA